MILVDANLLIYATTKCPRQQQARDWLDGQLNNSIRTGLPWPSLLAFLRVTTNRRLYSQPLPMEAAWGQVRAWIEWPTVWLPAPSERHGSILERTLKAVDGGNLVADAHLAALAIEHGLTLCSSDGDFARFPGLKWLNPLLSEG